MFCDNTLIPSITALAIALSEGKTKEEISYLGAAISLLGDTLSTIADQREYLEYKNTKDQEEN